LPTAQKVESRLQSDTFKQLSNSRTGERGVIRKCILQECRKVGSLLVLVLNRRFVAFPGQSKASEELEQVIICSGIDEAQRKRVIHIDAVEGKFLPTVRLVLEVSTVPETVAECSPARPLTKLPFRTGGDDRDTVWAYHPVKSQAEHALRYFLRCISVPAITILFTLTLDFSQQYDFPSKERNANGQIRSGETAEIGACLGCSGNRPFYQPIAASNLSLVVNGLNPRGDEDPRKMGGRLRYPSRPLSRGCEATGPS
jgi:hypothetical protein